jgi:23S rRNA (cytidine1920-2'-O)/16S rRNA (cytidine1409-2'-O)-methyltransferase
MKQRLDNLLVGKGLAQTKSKAQSLILAGIVFVNGEKTDKCGKTFLENVTIEIRGDQNPFVGRGGLKLQAALDEFKIDVKNKICLDVGASTGGFTDCLLQYSAGKVYAVDVGYGQLDFKLQKDQRVVILDRQNIRYLKKEQIPDLIDIVVIDVSFISLEKVIPEVLKFMQPKGIIVALIKPQFEVGKGAVEKGGIIKNKEKIEAVKERIKTLIKKLNLKIIGIIPSPILGQKGNQEFLIACGW